MKTLYYVELYNEGTDSATRMCISATSSRMAEMQAVNGMFDPTGWEVTYIQMVCQTEDHVDIEL